MSTASPDVGTRRVEHAAALVNPADQMRNVVALEDARVGQLLEDPHIDPYAGQPRVLALGRGMLAKAGLFITKPPQIVERPGLREAQAARKNHIESRLDDSREAIRSGTVFGVDDVVVDTYLGLREESSLLPDFFRQLHRQTEEKKGKKLSFLEWMADHADNEQLLNVWQWHDSYLQKLDSDPAFQEKVANVKQAYSRGISAAVVSGELHPYMHVTGEDVEAMDVVHASPLSSLTAIAFASADQTLNKVFVRGDIDEAKLFHEMTHLAKPGFHSVFTEGATELITSVIYNNAYPGNELYDLEHSPYEEQMDVLASFDRLAEGRLGVHELSRLYAGDNRNFNTVNLVAEADAGLAAPVCLYALQRVYAKTQDAGDIFTEAEIIHATQYLLRSWVSVLEDAYFDDHGKRMHYDADSLLERLLSSDILRRHEQSSVDSVIRILLKATENSPSR
jgi:hypothetical protein